MLLYTTSSGSSSSRFHRTNSHRHTATAATTIPIIMKWRMCCMLPLALTLGDETGASRFSGRVRERERKWDRVREYRSQFIINFRKCEKLFNTRNCILFLSICLMLHDLSTYSTYAPRQPRALCERTECQQNMHRTRINSIVDIG